MDGELPLPSAPDVVPPGKTARGWWIALAALVVAVGLVRARLVDMPLERDEGEYAYAGRLLLEGVPPYAAAYNMKLPGVYAAYAALMAVCGETIRGVHLGLLLTNALTTVLVFLLVRRLFGAAAGLASAAAFAVLSLNPASHGLFANAEHYVLPWAVGGMWLLVRTLERRGLGALLGSGLLFGTAFVMKQHGAAFALAGGLTLAAHELRRRPLRLGSVLGRIGLFAVAVAAPYLLTCLLLWGAGVFETFWFWTVTYARSYTAQVPPGRAWGVFERRCDEIMGVALGLWGLAAVGLSAAAWNRDVRRHGVLLVSFLLLSFAALTPGFFFRWHYFLLLTPIAALLAGAAVHAVGRLLAASGRWRTHFTVIGVLLFAAAVLEPVVRQRDYLFSMSPVQAVRATFGGNPFPESVELAKIIEAYADEDDTLAVIGSEPEIYFYTGRRSATGYIYVYPLLELHPDARRMNMEMIQEIEARAPDFLVYVHVQDSWLPRPGSDFSLYEWFRQYSRDYDTIGLAEIHSRRTDYFFDLDAMRRARTLPPRLSYREWYVAVLRRRR